jgi:phosphate transport system substrate-binding protein
MRNKRPNKRCGLQQLQGVLLGLLILFAAGCPSGNQPSGTVQGKVVLKGSNTIGEELAPRLITEYQQEHPAVIIELESKGTGTGFAALLAGSCDIADASRVASNDELTQARIRGIDLNVHTIGHYAVAVIVNGESPIGNLTREQVRDIFTGTVQNWKGVGGEDAPIHLYIRDPISGTYLGFRELAMEDKPYAANTTAFTNYPGITQAVAGDANGIGYTSVELAMTAGVKAISIRGVAPGALSVNEGRYPYSRVLRFYTNSTNETPATLDFIQFVQSPKGQSILTQMGFVPRL